MNAAGGESADDDAFRQRVGTLLRGKWTLERLIGVGGMAAVYVGVHRIGRRDAIKILHPSVAALPEMVERFEQEAHAVNRFKHPGAVEIRDFDRTDDGAPFLVMELLDGESLAERGRRLGPLPVDEVLGVTDELLDVLAAAHAEGIIHRDVKPANLFATSAGRLKVLDFGIARVTFAPVHVRGTATGIALGTPAFMAPEQVIGGHVDGRADLFAVGASMFRLIADRRIHEGVTDAERMVKTVTEGAPPLASVARHVPSSVASIVDRALALRPDDRYPDAASMQRDVRAARAGRPIAPVSPPRAEAGASPPRAEAGASPLATTFSGAAPVLATPVLGAPSVVRVGAEPASSAPHAVVVSSQRAAAPSAPQGSAPSVARPLSAPWSGAAATDPPVAVRAPVSAAVPTLAYAAVPTAAFAVVPTSAALPSVAGVRVGADKPAGRLRTEPLPDPGASRAPASLSNRPVSSASPTVVSAESAGGRAEGPELLPTFLAKPVPEALVAPGSSPTPSSGDPGPAPGAVRRVLSAVFVWFTAPALLPRQRLVRGLVALAVTWVLLVSLLAVLWAAMRPAQAPSAREPITGEGLVDHPTAAPKPHADPPRPKK